MTIKLECGLKGFLNLTKEFNNKKITFSKQKKSLLNKIGKDIQQDLINELPNRTGNLRSSIKYKIENNGNSVSIFTNLEYAKMLEYGTTGHIIKPKNKKSLKFEGNKFSKGHKVKGIKKGKYFEKEFIKKQKQLKSYGLKLINKVLKTK